MNNNKKVSVIAMITLLITVIGASYAYFTAQIGTAKTVNVTLTTGQPDVYSFATSGAITIGPVNQSNFKSTDGNKSGSSTGTVSLRAGTSAAATYCYEAYLNITANTFVYTTSAHTPEVVLTVTKNSTNVLSNYDITTKTGKVSFPTALNGSTIKHTITATAGSLKTDSWNVTITFVNLNSDQQLNAGKTLTGIIKYENVAC